MPDRPLFDPGSANSLILYQKVRNLFALSTDYRAGEATDQQFFASVQNKLLFAITRKKSGMSHASLNVPGVSLPPPSRLGQGHPCSSP